MGYHINSYGGSMSLPSGFQSRSRPHKGKTQPGFDDPNAYPELADETPNAARKAHKRPSRRSAVSFSDIYQMEPLERIRLIEAGVRPETFASIAQAMRRSKERLGQMMGLPVTTVDRKIQKGELLNSDQSERVVSAAKLIGQIETMVEESGDPQGFDAALWFDEWVDKPLAALGGRTPSELMGTAEGRELLSRLLATAQSGAYV
ncbi:DUF2384 domain-containing protein [Pusillimonas noertemannii]|nr:DUF2384 domain-containing protein [Pusillimonas noertemannii]